MEYCWISWDLCSNPYITDVLLVARPPTDGHGKEIPIDKSNYDCLAAIETNKKPKSRCLKYIIQHKYQTTYKNCKDNVKNEVPYMERCFVEQKLGNMPDVFASS